MLTYQDYQTALAQGELLAFIQRAIQQHMSSPEYNIARDADEYDHQRDVTVNNYTKFIAEHAASEFVNATAANNRISSNFFHRLNTQRCTYLLGNGVSFVNHITETTNDDGNVVQIDETKRRLGPRFDRDFYRLAYCALIHREAFGYWSRDNNGKERLYVFTLLEFVPLRDEITGALRAGIRFWRISPDKPLNAVLYDEQGFTTYASRPGTTGYDMVEVQPRTAYIINGYRTAAEGFQPTGSSNYSTLPIICMKGSDLYQSTLVGMRERIDSYDLIQSGFANDLQDCAQIYWIIENCGGMSEADLRAFLTKLNRDHVATADTKGMGVESSSLKPYVQDVPFQSRTAYLEHIRSAIYEDFGALDVTNMAAGDRTATEIEAAFQPLDETADDFETQCTDAIQQLLTILGIDDEPRYKRNRIINQLEQTQMVALMAQYLDLRTMLEHLPWLTVDEVTNIITRLDAEADERAPADDDETTPPDDDAQEA